MGVNNDFLLECGAVAHTRKPAFRKAGVAASPGGAVTLDAFIPRVFFLLLGLHFLSNFVYLVCISYMPSTI